MLQLHEKQTLSSFSFCFFCFLFFVFCFSFLFSCFLFCYSFSLTTLLLGERKSKRMVLLVLCCLLSFFRKQNPIKKLYEIYIQITYPKNILFDLYEDFIETNFKKLID